MNFMGKRVKLRAIESEDLPKLQEWANDPEIQMLVGGWHFPTSVSDQHNWYESLSCNNNNQRFAVVTDDLGLIGTANLVSIDWKNRTAFHGMLLGDAEIRGKGFGLDTIMAVMRYAFDELGLEHLDSDIIEYNKPSLRTYVEHCGWQVQGSKPNWYYRAGRRWDKILVGISNENYHNLLESNNYWEQSNLLNIC